MPLRVNTNVSAFNARRILNITGKDLNKRIERLSSGLRVNRAADDAAGLAISEGLRAEISGFSQGMRNAEQATNLIQTALGEMNGILLRMRELAVQSASSTVNDDNRTAINAEFTQLVNEIDRVARVTSYNDTALLSGYGNTVSQDATVSTALASPTTGVVAFQISGATSGTYLFADSAGDNEITLGNGVTTQTLNAGVISDMAANGVNLNLGSVSTSTLGAARSAIGAIDLAIDKVTTARGDLAAVQNRLGFSIRATGVMRENDMSSDSTIRDADIAAEVSAFSRAQILQQSGLAVFAQANVHAASALNLL